MLVRVLRLRARTVCRLSAEFDEQLVRHVAHLARLKLSDDAIAVAASHLSRVVDYVNLLNEVDTEGVAETAHPFEADGVMRDDVARSSVDREAAIKNAPDQAAGCFRVPRVLDQGDA